MIKHSFIFGILVLFFSHNIYAEDMAEQYSDADFEFSDEEFEEEFAEEESFEASDHFEFINRPIYKFNEKLYVHILRPVGKAYNRVTPPTVRNRISSFFSNLNSPVTIVNSLFQGKIRKTYRSTGRLIINSTIGIGGLYDPAYRIFKMEPFKEDFGQTLGHYGVGKGAYLQLPFLGPSTLRDFLSSPLDSWFQPKYYFIEPEVITGLEMVNRINLVSQLMPQADAAMNSAMDPYLMVRDGYLQVREQQVKE